MVSLITNNQFVLALVQIKRAQQLCLMNSKENLDARQRSRWAEETFTLTDLGLFQNFDTLLVLGAPCARLDHAKKLHSQGPHKWPAAY